jgi:hypothetical protein
MTEEIVGVGGKYYLPYQPYATYDQFIKIYTKAPEFFELKEKLDPNFRFSNALWEKYYVEYLNREESSKELEITTPKVSKEEFPKYYERKYEQTFLTLPEWHMVYSYSQLADFLKQGGSQTEYPFLQDVKRFWFDYEVAKQELGDFQNDDYRNMIYVIGGSFTIEYFIKYVYENTLGRVSELLFGHATGSDKFIADSWKRFSDSLSQTPWYKFDYFTEIGKVWTTVSLLDGNIIRNLERKLAITVGYGLKGVYGCIIEYLSRSAYGEEINETLSLVEVDEKEVLLKLEAENVLKILKEYEGGVYLVQSKRYAGFKDAFLRMLESGVKFRQIMSHESIMITYLSKSESEPFMYTDDVRILTKDKLFYNKEGYKYRVTVKVSLDRLESLFLKLDGESRKFEMIYDF